MTTYPSRFRRSFGGKDGIWWRKKKTREEQVEETQELAPTTTTTTTTTANDHSIIGWDPVLCRPIFKEVVSSSSHANHDSSSLEDSTSESKPILVTTTTKAKVQRPERSYGGRKRPYVVIDLLQDSPIFMETTKPKETVEDDNNEPLPLPVPSTPSRANATSLVIEDPATDGSSSSEQEKHATHKKQHRGLFQGKTKRERCASTCTDSLAPIVVAEPSVLSNRPDSKKNATVLDFTDEQVPPPAVAATTQVPKVLLQQLHQPNSNTSLRDAKRFFERLDATQELTLDSSDTPVATSKVIRRTNRRQISQSSPTVLHDYQDYQKCSNESGVTPLSLPNFLKSRSLQTSELYDAFLDDEEEE